MNVAHFSPEAWRFIFNTPLECGLRSAALLLAAYPSRCDVQRLVQYEYLLVHSADVEGGPPSLHPPAPHRAGELLIRRPFVERGITFMLSKTVISRHLSERGISYSASDVALSVFDSLESSYTRLLRERAKWVSTRFGNVNDAALAEFMQSNWSTWGSEFTLEAFVRRGHP